MGRLQLLDTECRVRLRRQRHRDVRMEEHVWLWKSAQRGILPARMYLLENIKRTNTIISKLDNKLLMKYNRSCNIPCRCQPGWTGSKCQFIDFGK